MFSGVTMETAHDVVHSAVNFTISVHSEMVNNVQI